MSKLTEEEVAGWIRNLIPYLENPAIIAPEGYWDEDKLNFEPGKIQEYGDNLSPAVAFILITQTENIKALTELYRVVKTDASGLTEKNNDSKHV